jgi:conserved oligomeric Golgi complex subunit 2
LPLTGLNKNQIDNSINIYVDIQNLLQRIPQFLKIVEVKIPIANNSILKNSLSLSESTLQDTKLKIRESIVGELFEHFNVQLKQVSDIPRLYRKTNRSIPTKPCTYIEVVSKALKDFNDSAMSRLDNAFLIALYEALFNIMTVS